MGTISQDHAKLDSNTIADAIRPLVEADPSIKVKSIIAEVQSRFNYTISYHKAWLAKKKAIAKTPSMVESNDCEDVKVSHYKPLVQVDGTHLYRKYKGALLFAVTQDGNQNIVPIAFAIVEGETADT
ncbi:uncharacterized protein [Arachis hypogaea]|uniref:uncharacterized protein n=1 Tax=Arachis hypogaea TaxID=3818 RepID=UPI000DEC9B92|nr:uncharacterized protein LOC112698067 [Arachis hypogaea]